MPSTTEGSTLAGRLRVHPVIDWLGVTAWRLIGIGIVFVAAVWVLAKLWVIVVAVAIAVLFSRALHPAAEQLRRLGLRPALVAATTLLGFGLLMGGIIAALVPAVASEFEDLGPTIERSIDDVEDWLVEDSPFDVSRRDIREFRDQADDRVGDALSSSSGQVVSRTMVVFELVTALVLALITSFFILKDGGRFGQWTLTLLPERRRALVSRLANRAWRTLGGYLRGSATLGVVEGAIIGLTVWIVGGHLAVPVAVVTFFAAFIPFAGAIVAGAIAVLVTLVTAGFGPGGRRRHRGAPRAAARQRPAGADRLRTVARAAPAHRAVLAGRRQRADGAGRGGVRRADQRRRHQRDRRGAGPCARRRRRGRRRR